MSNLIEKSRKMLPVDTLRDLLDYNPESGELTWKIREAKWFKKQGFCAMWNRRWAGKKALAAPLHSSRGPKKCYLGGHILGVNLTAHRVCFAHYHGYWPDFVVDHINGDTTDNRIENLREATHQQNAVNRERSVSNTSGYTNIKRTANGRYSVKVSVGVFDTLEEAVRKYNDASEALHGEFALKHSL